MNAPAEGAGKRGSVAPLGAVFELFFYYADVFNKQNDRGSVYPDPRFFRSPAQRLEQYFTSSHVFSHFLRQLNGR